MKVPLSPVRWTVAALVPILFIVPTARSGEQSGSSLTELDVETRELKVTLDTVLDDNRQLREALSRSEAALLEMRKAAAANNGEAEVFRRQALELKKRFQALGSGVSGDSRKLEERLLAAVSDLQQNDVEKKSLVEAMIRLCEAALRYSKSVPSGDPEARLSLEAEIRNANLLLVGGASSAVEGTPVSPTLTDAIVISVREELSLVVANLGRKQGVKVGMPFQVIRGNAVIGLVRVVDVRETLAGAVIQHLASEASRISVGDRLKVEVQP